MTITMTTSMTKQDIFNKSVKAMAAQGFKQSRELNGCRYRFTKDTGEKMVCAIGALIDNDHYDPVFEGGGISMDVIRALNSSGVEADIVFLYELMNCHDYGFKPETMKSDFRNMAEKYGLSLPPELSTETI